MSGNTWIGGKWAPLPHDETGWNYCLGGGAMPVSESTFVDVIWRGYDGLGYPKTGEAGRMGLQWEHRGGVGDILAWRLALSVPVGVITLGGLSPAQRLALARS